MLRVLFPAFDFFKLRFPLAKLSDERRQGTLDPLFGLLAVLCLGALAFIGGADLDFVQVVQQVKMSHENRIDRVDPLRMLHEVQVRPSKFERFLWQAVV